MLNIHYYQPSILEIVRLGYWWANKKCILSELNNDTIINDFYKKSCFYTNYDNLVNMAIDILKNPEKMKVQSEFGFKIFKEHSYPAILESIVGIAPNNKIFSSNLPKILNVGSGKTFYD